MATQAFETTIMIPDIGGHVDPATVLGRSPEIFAIRLEQMTAIFALRSLPTLRPKTRDGVPFLWTQCHGFNLPAFTGEIRTRQLGPITSVHIRASYTHADGIAAQLFQEVVGHRLARATFEKLVGAICTLLQPKAAKKPAA